MAKAGKKADYSDPAAGLSKPVPWPETGQNTRREHMTGRRRFLLSLLALAGAAGGFAPLRAGAQESRPLYHRLGTGSSGGVYFPIGALIAGAISNPPGARPCDQGGSCGVPGLIAAAQTTAGSVDNLRQITAGTLESGLAQADIAMDAFEGRGQFAGEWMPGLRAVASLYPEAIQILVPQDSPLDTLADLRGKRVALGAEGSGILVDSRRVLKAMDIAEKDLQASYLPPTEAARLFMAGELDAMFFFGGYPADLVTGIARTVNIRLLGLPDPVAARIREDHPAFVPQIIPAGTYFGTEDTRTLGVHAIWVVSASMPAELVHDMVQALWHPTAAEMLKTGHALGGHLTLETALSGVSLPLHAGARRYYKQRGMLPDQEVPW